LEARQSGLRLLSLNTSYPQIVLLSDFGLTTIHCFHQRSTEIGPDEFSRAICSRLDCLIHVGDALFTLAVYPGGVRVRPGSRLEELLQTVPLKIWYNQVRPFHQTLG
jgi:hypothetical protein